MSETAPEGGDTTVVVVEHPTPEPSPEPEPEPVVVVEPPAPAIPATDPTPILVEHAERLTRIETATEVIAAAVSQMVTRDEAANLAAASVEAGAMAGAAAGAAAAEEIVEEVDPEPVIDDAPPIETVEPETPPAATAKKGRRALFTW